MGVSVPSPDKDLPPPPTSGQGSRRTPWRRLWYLLAACIGIVILIRLAEPILARWVSRSGSDPITKQEDLQKLPESRLYFPGAALISTGGHDYEWGIWGSNSAIWSSTLGASVSKEEVFAYYERELVARGWHPSVGDIAVTTTEIDGRGWRKDRVAIQVSVFRKNDFQNPSTINAYQTPYRLTLVADRPKNQR